MRRSVVVLLLLPLLGLVPAGPATAAPAEDGLAVTGYAQSSLPNRAVRRNAPGLTTLTVVGASLTPDGRSVRRPPRDTTRLGATAHRHGLRAELLLSNYSNRLGEFDTRAGGRLLRSEANVRRVARRLAGFVAAGGWDGVNLDLEALRRADGPGLVLLASELQRLMPAERTVSIDISARGTLASYRKAGYRLPELAAAVDAVQLMAYDEHGPTWTGPGPIGSLDWQRRSLEVLLSAVPREQVDLGVAGYGYTWPARASGRTGRSVTVPQARNLVRRDGARARWDAEAGEWHARLANGTRLWWSDGRSLELRRELAAEQGLHGLAIWRIGSADPLTPTS